MNYFQGAVVFEGLKPKGVDTFSPSMFAYFRISESLDYWIVISILMFTLLRLNLIEFLTDNVCIEGTFSGSKLFFIS